MEGQGFLPDRALAMAARVDRELDEAGGSGEARRLLDRALSLAMKPRHGLDDHHPDYLHPARSALILLRDAGVREGRVLSAAAVAESERPELRAAPEAISAALGPEVAALAAAVPVPGSEGLAEVLVTADEATRLVALAERLDHLRHAHLRDDRDAAWRGRVHAEAEAVYGPVAERTHPGLARRYRAWLKGFRKRL